MAALEALIDIINKACSEDPAGIKLAEEKVKEWENDSQFYKALLVITLLISCRWERDSMPRKQFALDNPVHWKFLLPGYMRDFNNFVILAELKIESIIWFVTLAELKFDSWFAIQLVSCSPFPIDSMLVACKLLEAKLILILEAYICAKRTKCSKIISTSTAFGSKPCM